MGAHRPTTRAGPVLVSPCTKSDGDAPEIHERQARADGAGSGAKREPIMEGGAGYGHCAPGFDGGRRMERECLISEFGVGRRVW